MNNDDIKNLGILVWFGAPGIIAYAAGLYWAIAVLALLALLLINYTDEAAVFARRWRRTEREYRRELDKLTRTAVGQAESRHQRRAQLGPSDASTGQ